VDIRTTDPPRTPRCWSLAYSRSRECRGAVSNTRQCSCQPISHTI